jgi:hypothetical protein
MKDSELLKEIEDVHIASYEAMKNNKLETYIEFFTDDLQYKQLNGKIIGKAQLAKDIQIYFNRIRSFSGRYERKEITIDKDRIVEKLIQHSKVSLRIFIFFSKNWTIEREGIYEWLKVNGSWKIYKVEILKEKVS